MARRKGVSGFVNSVAGEDIEEKDKQIKEEQKLEKQREKLQVQMEKDNYINSRYEEAENHNIKINKEVEELKSILHKGVSKYKCISIDEFIKKDIQELTLPDELLIKNPEPIKPQIKPANLIQTFIKPIREKYNKYVEELELQYSNGYKLYEEKENKILEEIVNRKEEYDLHVKGIKDNGKNLYKDANPDFISSYKKHILNNSEYPFNYNKKIDVNYFNESKELLVNYLLPKRDIIPTTKEYKYLKTKDEITKTERKLKEINDIYKEVILSIPLRTMYESFNSHAKEHIDSIVFNGYIEDIDLSTGRDINPCMISVMTSKQDFNERNLSKIDKYKCLDDMNARLSIDSNFEFKEVFPIKTFDSITNCIIEDDNINLLKMDPFDFEKFATNLLRKMGYDAIPTKPSKDGGIDGEFYYNDSLISGKIVIQVKRYKDTVGIANLREFDSVIKTSKAMKGIMIATSEFSQECKELALEENIQLIGKSELLRLLNEYGINAYIKK
jgi:restriction system protein